MARYLIQSARTGQFLVPDAVGGGVDWCINLRGAGGGVFDDIERAAQLIDDHCDFDDKPQVIDLDLIGTENDYSDAPQYAPIDDADF